MKNAIETAQTIEQGEKIAREEDRWTGQESSSGKVVSGKVPHILYVIDQLCQLGGAERVLLEIIGRLPQDRFRCSVVTFQIEPGLKALENVSSRVRVLPLQRTYDMGAVRTALLILSLIHI